MKKLTYVRTLDYSLFFIKAIILFFLIGTTAFATHAATITWTGAVDTDWNTAGNWDANAVPLAADDVVIPDVSNDPVVNAAVSVRSILVNAGGALTVSATGSITLNLGASFGIRNEGTVTNNGHIDIGNTGSTGARGIHNFGTFNNNAGEITINNSTINAITNPGTFNNQALLTIGLLAATGSDMISNSGTLNNTASGTISLNRGVAGTCRGMIHQSGAITNEGSILIGNISGSITAGIFMFGSSSTISNTGDIFVDRLNQVNGSGISMLSGVVNNDGSFGMGTNFDPTNKNIVNLGTSGGAFFNNNAGGTLYGKGTIRVPGGGFNQNGGTLEPGASSQNGDMNFSAGTDFSTSTIRINANGTSASEFGKITVSGVATLGGSLDFNINYSPSPGDFINFFTATSLTGTFSNVTGLPTGWQLVYNSPATGDISIVFGQQSWTGAVSSDWQNPANWAGNILPGATASVTIPPTANDPVISTAVAIQSVTVESGASLTIGAAGSLALDGSTGQAILNDGTVTNNGDIAIGGVSSVGVYGIVSNGTFNHNAGTISIDRASTAFVFTSTSGVFNNSSLLIMGSASTPTRLINGDGAGFNNNPNGILEGVGTIESAAFVDNGGTLKPGNPTGELNFWMPEDLSLADFEVRVNSNSNFGRIHSLWQLSIGGAVSFDFSNYSDTPIPGTSLQIFESAGDIIGAISSVSGLPPGWYLNDFVTNISLIYTTDPIWTGYADSNWENPLNWATQSLPPANAAVTLSTTSLHFPTINSAVTISSIVVPEGAMLTITAGGSLTGQVENNGMLENYGTMFPVGTPDAILNNGDIVNYGDININNPSTGIDNQYSITGLTTFTNHGTITITSPFRGISTDFSNEVEFYNFGTITITDMDDFGLFFGENAMMHNEGTIHLSGGTPNWAFGSASSNNHNAGTITLDDIPNWGIYTYGFENEGEIIMGENSPVAVGIFGAFTNLPGGTIRGTSEITDMAPYFFENAGGILSPGFSPGILTFGNGKDFTNSTLEMEVNGTGTPGVNFDQLVVNGTATLGGTLALSINYSPANGDVITIVNATSLTGTFSTVTGLLPDWTLSYNSPTAGKVSISYLNPLPVELVEFQVFTEGKDVRLRWKTATEQNNLGFSVERSLDGLAWMEIGFVEGHGSTVTEHRYAFLDEKPLSGVNYYRLRQVDFDGKTEYSPVRSVQFFRDEYSFQIYPNPATEAVYFNWGNEQEGEAMVRIFNSLGALVIQQKMNLEPNGNNRIELNGLPDGVYQMKIDFGGLKSKSVSLMVGKGNH